MRHKRKKQRRSDITYTIGGSWSRHYMICMFGIYECVFTTSAIGLTAILVLALWPSSGALMMHYAVVYSLSQSFICALRYYKFIYINRYLHTYMYTYLSLHITACTYNYCIHICAVLAQCLSPCSLQRACQWLLSNAIAAASAATISAATATAAAVKLFTDPSFSQWLAVWYFAPALFACVILALFDGFVFIFRILLSQ